MSVRNVRRAIKARIRRTVSSEPAYFPVRGHQTLKEIDDFLADCGVSAHGDCFASRCAITRRYQRLRENFLAIVLREVRADRGVK